jgi:glycosyltransferase involved in cell wall biosynthesis
VPYYFDLAPFRAISRTDDVPERLKLLYSGKLVHRKGLDLLLMALQQVSQCRTDFHLSVLGAGPDERLVAERTEDLRSRIELLGFREVREIPAVYATNDVLVFPTRYDGWGLAVIEAMAAGMPVVASRAAVAAVDALQDNVTGFLCDSESAPSLAQAILRMLDAKDRVRSMGLAARTAAQPFDAQAGAGRLVELLTRQGIKG